MVISIFNFTCLAILLTYFKASTQFGHTGLIHNDADIRRPIGFKSLPGTNYKIVRKRYSWADALEYCTKCVGNFATFEKSEAARLAQDAIYNISHFSPDFDVGLQKEEFGLNRRYWFGLRDQSLKEGVWKWVGTTKVKPKSLDNVESYPWYTNQPDHLNNDTLNRREHCAGFWNPNYYLDQPSTKQEKHTFNDMDCDTRYYFICEGNVDIDKKRDETDFCYYGKDNKI